KLSFFPDVKLGINVPARGKAMICLRWIVIKTLLTPPETPLFRSLDDEEEQFVGQASRGRAQSKGMQISRPSTMDNAQRSSRSSASPNRFSLSPRSMARTKSPISASRASPPLSVQPPTPSRRPSTPPAAKISAFHKGLQWLSIKWNKEASPVKANHRSSSTKPQGWQSNDPAFSYNAPPKTVHLYQMFGIPRSIASSKKLSKFFPISAPKWSFDSAVWLMDHRKGPQDRFRPLLSSVPATTFGAGKINNVHKPMFSHNSSMTTSSNASSEHGATFGPYVESDQEQQDLIGEWDADDGLRVHEDIFMFDKLDELNEETSYNKSTKYVEDSPIRVKYVKSDKHDFDMERWAANQTPYDGADSSQVGHGEMATCSRCGMSFNVMDSDGKGDSCGECSSKVEGFSADHMLWTSVAHQHGNKIVNSEPCVESEPSIAPDSVDYSKHASLGHQTVNNEPLADCTEKCPPGQSMVDTDEDMLLGQEVVNYEENMRPYHESDSLVENEDDVSFSRSSISNHQQIEPTSAEHGPYRGQMDTCNHGLPPCLNESDCQHNEAVSETAFGDNSHQLGSTIHPFPKVESAEGAGISVLLHQKSSSNKWPVMEGSALAATNIVCSEPYYTRDGINMMKRSFGRDNSSASSIDLGSSRQSDAHFERRSSSKKGDFEKAQPSSTMSRQSIASVSDMSVSGSSASLCHQTDAVEDTYSRIDTLESSASRTVVSAGEDGSSKDALSNALECLSTARPIVNDDIPVDLNSSSFDRSSETEDVISMGRMADNDHSTTNMCLSEMEEPINVQESSAAEGSCMLKTDEDTSDTVQCCLVGTPEYPSEENLDNLIMQSEAVQDSIEEHILDDCCVSAISEEDVLVSRTGTSIIELPNGEKSPQAVEGSRKQIQRCFTLEEATDTILLCSSIVHDLAYKAATIALEHEQESERHRPTVTIVGKPIPDEDDFLKLPHRRTPNRKVKRKRLEGETTTITETAEKESIAEDPSPARSASGITRASVNMKPPKLESKCNCVIM
ncbi:hypothetical protein ZWY2020_051941, partial [Hordeum vulgare]